MTYQEFRIKKLEQHPGITEEEIQELWNADRQAEELEDQNDEHHDPCYGCPRFDGGYNCKHCRYGDDGNYSIWDVYRPSELL